MFYLSAPALFAALFTITLYILYRIALPKPIPGIPHNEDSARRLMGDVPYVLALQNAGKRPREFWADLCRKKNSPIAQFFPGPFNKPVVIISDYREAQDLLTRRSTEIDKGGLIKMMWSGLVPTHFVGLDTKDPVTAESKGLVKDIMGPKYIATISTPAIYSNVLNLIDMWRYKAEIAKGRPFKAIDDICFLTADSIFETALGITGSEKNLVRNFARLQQENHFAYAGNLAPENEYHFPQYEFEGLLSTIVRLTVIVGGFPTAPIHSLFWPFTNLRPSVKKVKKDVHNLISHYIIEAVSLWEREGKPKPMTNALQFIIWREREAAEKQGRKPDFQRKLFHDSLYGYCFAGQDTTHSALSFLVKYIGGYPETQARLRRELREVHAEALAEGRNPTAEEINKAKLPFLDAYIEEVMRLNASASAVAKETMEDIEIFGHHVPKGTSLLFSVWGPSVGESAIPVSESVRSQSSRENKYTVMSDLPLQEFHPERWLYKDAETGEDVFNPKAAPQIVFSLGPRECWGRRLAYLQIRMLLTMLLWNFECEELPKNLQNWEVVDVLNAKPKVCLVKLKTLM